jgi:DNA-binding MarR family transcriptional regulator
MPAMNERGAGPNQQEAATTCARQTFALLPSLRQFVTSRVQAAGADLGLSLRQFAALRGIEEGASSPGELARLWQVTPAVITGIVDRLERRGLVRREPDPEDRRRLRLALTEAGRRASDEVEAALTGELAARFAAATREELGELSRALALLQRTFSALDATTPGNAPRHADDELPVWSGDASGDREVGGAGGVGLKRMAAGQSGERP